MFCILTLWLASPLCIPGKSRMRKRARTDLCGGRSAMVVPTATAESIARGGCFSVLSPRQAVAVEPRVLVSKSAVFRDALGTDKGSVEC